VLELVLNLGEVGISDCEDCKTKIVVVPGTMPGQMIHHEISRTVKYISVIACISAAGELLTPYIITLQASTSVQERLKEESVRFGTDFVLRSNPSPSINAEIFFDYIRTVFLPNLGELRTLDAFTEETGVLLMDNRPSHVMSLMISSVLSPKHECASQLLHHIQLKSFKFLM
jgi:hypothetical protein